jgi:hypothetical protein
MNEIIKGLIDRIKADKRTTWLAALAAAVYGAGSGLSQAAFEPAGSIVSACGVVIAGGALLFTTLSPPKPPPAIAPAIAPAPEQPQLPPQGPPNV